MVAEVKNKLPEIVETCKQMHLASLYLVSSGARVNDFTPDSDLDFLYTMKKDAYEQVSSGLFFFDLIEKLEKITGRKVDLIAEDGQK